MRIFAGIDGGQSHSAAVVVSDDGLILGRGSAGPSDHVGQASDSRRAAEACEHAVATALAAAGLDLHTPLAAVVAGISGFEGTWHGIEPRFGRAIVRYEHDAPVALAAATDERPAAVLIAGSGSVGYGERRSGERITVGGYGYLFGDEGSGFALGRAALSAAMQTNDAGRSGAIAERALARFEVASLRALARAVSLYEVGREDIARFAREVLTLAADGDVVAQALVREASDALVRLAVLIVSRIADPQAPAVSLALSGGMFADGPFRAAVIAGVASELPAVRVLPERYEPAVGAALLAFDAVGVPRPAKIRL